MQTISKKLVKYDMTKKFEKFVSKVATEILKNFQEEFSKKSQKIPEYF